MLIITISLIVDDIYYLLEAVLKKEGTSNGFLRKLVVGHPYLIAKFECEQERTIM